MSVGVIKSELTRFQSELQNCITQCDTLIHVLNGVTTATSNTVITPVITLTQSIEKQGNLLNSLYSLPVFTTDFVYRTVYNSVYTCILAGTVYNDSCHQGLQKIRFCFPARFSEFFRAGEFFFIAD